jgi:hypothetical protein
MTTTQLTLEALTLTLGRAPPGCGDPNDPGPDVRRESGSAPRSPLPLGLTHRPLHVGGGLDVPEGFNQAIVTICLNDLKLHC